MIPCFATQSIAETKHLHHHAVWQIPLIPDLLSRQWYVLSIFDLLLAAGGT